MEPVSRLILPGATFFWLRIFEDLHSSTVHLASRAIPTCQGLKFPSAQNKWGSIKKTSKAVKTTSILEQEGFYWNDLQQFSTIEGIYALR